jgi:hypothetical protein
MIFENDCAALQSLPPPKPQSAPSANTRSTEFYAAYSARDDDDVATQKNINN